MNTQLEKRTWWNYIHDDLKELLKQAVILLEQVERWDEKFRDYSFIVFPAAKAYEGFLKTLFLDLEFITEDDYYGKRFRIGKALNPALEPEFREKESVYDKLTSFCQGNTLPDKLWDTWKKARNLLFHWFPNEKNVINFQEAKERVALIFDAMDKAFEECKITKDA